jgi:hypothetical protein
MRQESKRLRLVRARAEGRPFFRPRGEVRSAFIAAAQANGPVSVLGAVRQGRRRGGVGLHASPSAPDA